MQRAAMLGLTIPSSVYFNDVVRIQHVLTRTSPLNAHPTREMSNVASRVVGRPEAQICGSSA